MTSQTAQPSDFDRAVAAVADVLRESGAVPLPGGNGAFFSAVRRRHPQLFVEPGIVGRCYVCLALLGESETTEKWNRTEWLPHATAWFNTWCPELAATLDKPRWQYMLAAMLKVVEDRFAGNKSRQKDLSDLQSCHKVAFERIKQLYSRHLSKQLTMPVQATAGRSLEQFDPKWKTVEAQLQGENGARIEMLYFMHVLHSSLGLASHSVDLSHPNRRDFYDKMLQVLSDFDGTCALCHARQRIVGALKTTALMSGNSVHVALLMQQLPVCFQPTTIMSRPPIIRNVARRLSDSTAIERMFATHDLAEAMADRMMDFVWAARPSGPVFTPEDYCYAQSLVKDGRRRYQLLRRRQALFPSEPGLTDDLASASVPMNRRFVDQMTIEERLIKISRDRLTDLSPEITWSERVKDECKACRSAAAGKGL